MAQQGTVAAAIFAAGILFSVFSSFTVAQTAPNYLEQSDAANEMCAKWWQEEQAKKARDPKYVLKEVGPACSVQVECGPDTPMAVRAGNQVAAAAIVQQCTVGGHCFRDKCRAEGLPGLPEETQPQPLPPNSTTEPLDPNANPSPIQTPDVSPQNPSSPTTPPANTQPNANPTPLPSDSIRPSPDGSGWEAELISESPPASPSPLPGWQSGSTFSSPPSVVSPNPGYGSLDAGGYANPFINPSGTTFGGGWSGSGTVAPNLFSNFISGLGGLFSGFGGGASAPQQSSPAPSPSPTAEEQEERVQNLLDRFRSRVESQAAARRAEEERQKYIEDMLNVGAQSPFTPFQSDDRTGLPAPGEKTLDEILQDLSREKPRIPTESIQEQETPTPVPPQSTGPSPAQVAENNGGMTDVSPPLPNHPDWWPQDVERKFAQTLEAGYEGGDAIRRAGYGYARDVAEGLMNGEVAADAQQIGTARRILEEGVAAAEWSYDRFQGTGLGLTDLFDRIDMLPDFVKSAERQALNAARDALDAFAYAEGIARLRADVVGMTPTPAAQAQARLRELADQYNALSKSLADAKDAAGWGGAIERFLLPESMESQGIADIKMMEASLGQTEKRLNALAIESNTRITYSMTVGEPWKVAVDSSSGAVVSDSPVYGEETFPDSIQTVTPQPLPPNTTPQPLPPNTTPTTIDTTDTPVQNVTSNTAPQPLPIPSASSPKPAPQPSPAPSPAPQPSPAPMPSPAPQSSNGFIRGSVSLLGSLLNSLVSFFTGSGSEPQSTAPTQTLPASSASITANPSTINDGDTTQLVWSSVGTTRCIVVDSQLNVIAQNGPNGEVYSAALMESTRYGVVCDIENGSDKYINETLVRVEGDATDPERIFAQVGRASSAVPVSASASTNASANTSGGTPNDAPLDVRTCDPDQSMDTFIRCLCEAEPNPNGCTIPPGGI